MTEQHLDDADVGAVLQQVVAKLCRQHDGAILAALAVLDPDHHPDTVDVADLQADRLGGPQPRRIGRGQRGTGLQAGHPLRRKLSPLTDHPTPAIAGSSNPRFRVPARCSRKERIKCPTFGLQ